MKMTMKVKHLEEDGRGLFQGTIHHSR